MHTQDAHAWLVRILTNLFINHCRAAVRMPASAVWNVEASETPDGPELTTPTRDEILAAIKTLEPHFREVTELFLVQGKSYGEIATILNLPIAIVGTRLARARIRLRKSLTETCSA